MEDSYGVALLVGALILIYQAWREYSNSDTVVHLKSSNQPVRKDLEKVRMSALTTEAEYVRGRWIYILGFFMLYLLLINFPDIAGMLIQTNGEISVDGGAEVALGSWLLDGSDQTPVLDSDPTMPILVAIAMVVGVASPTFKVVETAIRSVAYAISGVPRNIYRVISNLENLPYDDYIEDEELPLKTSFNKYLQSQRDNAILFSEGTTKHIISSLTIIDLLQGPIIGPQRNIFFTLFSGETPLERIDGLRARYNVLRDKIAKLSHAENPVASVDEILTESTDLAGSTQCLFALFAIRSRKIGDGAHTPMQQRMVQDITATGNLQSINDIMIAAFFGVICGGVLMSLYANFLIGNAAEQNVDATHQAVRSLMAPLLPSVVFFSILLIFLRHVKVDQGDWDTNDVNNINFSGYARIVIGPTIFAIILYTVVMTANSEDVWVHLASGDLSQARNVGLSFVGDEVRQLPKLVALFFFFGCGLLFVADQHDNLPWQITIGVVGTVLSMILLVVAMLFEYMVQTPDPDGGILTGNSVSVLLLIPFAVTMFFYASAAEFAETKKGKKLIQHFSSNEGEENAV